MSGARRRRQSGLSLIELMGVMLILGLVGGIAVNFFIDLTQASEAATARTREGRRAAAILDRVARDLQSAVLVTKPEERDPLEHPWLFLAESGTGPGGAERLLFVSRGRIARASATHESDLERVAYFLATAEDGTTDLMRWSSPRLPEGLERDFPRPDSEGAVVLANDVAAFGVRLMGDGGEWTSDWDSSTVALSSQLPLSAEISVAVYTEELAEREQREDFGEAEEPPLWARRVDLPVRPLDLAALLSGEEGAGSADGDEDEEGDGDGEEDGDAGGGGPKTVAQCLSILGLSIELPANVNPNDPVTNWVHLVQGYNLDACL